MRLNAGAVFLGVGLNFRARVYELTRQGILPSIRIGQRQLRFEEERLLRWIRPERTDGVNVDAKLSAEDPRERVVDKTSTGQSNKVRTVRDQVNQSPMLLDHPREFEPLRFIIECTIRAG